MEGHPAHAGACVALGVLLLVASATTAADPCDPFVHREIASPPAPSVGDSFLLAATRQGAAPSFFLGTFHSADPRVRERWEPAALLLATGNIRLVLTEREADPPLGGADDPRLLPVGESLRPAMEALGLGDRFTAATAAHGRLADVFERFRPWVAAALVEQGPARTYPENRHILDEVLRRHAQRQGIAVEAMESLASLARQHDRVLGRDDQIALLAAAICNEQTSARLVAALTDAYAGNDPRAFYRAMGSLGSADPALEAKVMSGLVGARDERFWRRIEPELAAGGVLVVVGNLHLLGESGIAAHLRQAGFSVTAVDPARLGVSIAAEQVPALTDWVRDRLSSRGLPGGARFDGLRIEPRSLATLRRLRCPGQRCRIDGTYLPDEGKILLATAIHGRLLGGVAPTAEFHDGALRLTQQRRARKADNATAYAESILVRELARHALHRAPSGAREADDREPACRASRILHHASRAQAAYLRERGATARAHVFALDPRCGP